MRLRRAAATAMTLVGLLGISAVWGRIEQAGPAADARPLDPEVTSVRLLLGLGDDEVERWDGKVSLDRGEVLAIDGYRFRAGDSIDGRAGWKADSDLIRTKAAAKAAQKKAAQKKAARKKAARKQAEPKAVVKGPSTDGREIAPNGVVIDLKAPGEATLSVETAQGAFTIPLAELADGAAHRYLDRRVEARRVPPRSAVVEGPETEDFPAAAADAEGGAWVAYVVHKPFGPEVLESFTERPKNFDGFAPKGGGDQIRLIHFADGRPGKPIEVTGAGLDVWRPSVAVDGEGRVVVAWSENKGGNFDIYARTYSPSTKAWSEIQRLTTDPGADADVVLAADPKSGVWMAWQAWRDGQADILLAPVGGREGVAPYRVSSTPANEWSPSLAVGAEGRAFVAFDSYRAGNYDVVLHEVRLGAELKDGHDIPVADSPMYEARPVVAVDPRGRAWVAYEERDAGWGKDAENLVDGKGSSLYRSAAVRVRCVDGRRVLAPADPIDGQAEAPRIRNSFPRLEVDRSGRVWLAFRHREEAIWGANAVMVLGAVWTEYVTSLAGPTWTPPQPLSRSDGLLDNRPAIVTRREGPPLIVYATDGRLRREVEFTPEYRRRFWAHSGTPGNPGDSFNWDIEVAALVPTGAAGTVDPAVSALEGRAPAAREATPVHPNEAADVERMRNYRVEAGGKAYRLMRGDFHRHTEISQDGGSDGALEDMWRYAIDAAGLDWMGDADHDNGGGKEYTWWLVQKTTDLYHHAPRLVTMFSYERSVVYPHGHRNVMFARRGVRTLPRLVSTGLPPAVLDEDTPMLYDYLKQHDGITASHTSATGMGTDWRDVDPRFEPFVEIYQGHRDSYEHLGAPRVPRRPGEAIGGWRPLGMVWNALALQYRFGFQASSDHISTHISYAVAVAEEPTRASVLDAFRRRHCYGATDNIVLDVRSGEQIMGDEFNADGPVRIKVRAIGTRPIAKVDVIKDFKYVFSTEPNRPDVQFDWTDEEKRGPGLSWYYVRVQQDDGQLAWGSPIWVHFGNAPER
jgi:hypothetical protein